MSKIEDDSDSEFWEEIYTPIDERISISKKEIGDTKVEYWLSASDEAIDSLIEEMTTSPEMANITSSGKCLAQYDTQKRSLEIFPTTTWLGYEHTFPNKYEKIESILFEDIEYRYISSTATLEGMLKKTPKCFIREPFKGLGFRKEHRYIVENIEKLTNCSKIVVTHRENKRSDDDFIINPNTLDNLTKEIDNINSRANAARNEVKDTTSYNAIANLIGIKPRDIRFGRHPIRKLVTRAALNDYNLDEHSQQELLQAVETNARSLVQKSPEKVEKLKGDLELATLDDLISKFEAKLKQNISEPDWQKFLKSNPIILSLASSYPLIFVEDEASIGGRRINGKGEKVTDYVYKNQVTDNALIVEIKRPSEGLISKEYRGGVYSVRSEISGAINQIRDQKHKLIKSLSELKQNAIENDETLNLETFSVDCLLVVGMTPEETSKRRSWELFRGGLADVGVITFDELLTKLKNIRAVF